MAGSHKAVTRHWKARKRRLLGSIFSRKLSRFSGKLGKFKIKRFFRIKKKKKNCQLRKRSRSHCLPYINDFFLATALVYFRSLPEGACLYSSHPGFWAPLLPILFTWMYTCLYGTFRNWHGMYVSEHIIKSNHRRVNRKETEQKKNETNSVSKKFPVWLGQKHISAACASKKAKNQ